MKFLLAILCIALETVALAAQTPVWQPSPGHAQIPIWPATPPDAHPAKASVTEPVLTQLRISAHLEPGT